jgi:hypothetical protein
VLTVVLLPDCTLSAAPKSGCKSIIPHFFAKSVDFPARYRKRNVDRKLRNHGLRIFLHKSQIFGSDVGKNQSKGCDVLFWIQYGIWDWRPLVSLYLGAFPFCWALNHRQETAVRTLQNCGQNYAFSVLIVTLLDWRREDKIYRTERLQTYPEFNLPFTFLGI